MFASKVASKILALRFARVVDECADPAKACWLGGLEAVEASKTVPSVNLVFNPEMVVGHTPDKRTIFFDPQLPNRTESLPAEITPS